MEHGEAFGETFGPDGLGKSDHRRLPSRGPTSSGFPAAGDDRRSLDVVSTTAQFDPRAVRRDWAILDGVFLVAAVNDERHPRAHGREPLTALCLPWLLPGGAGVRTEALVGQAAVSNDWSRGIPALDKLGVA